MTENTENFNLDFLEESNDKVLADITVSKTATDKEFLPTAYKVYRCKLGVSERQLLDTYIVKQGYFEMAKGLAVKKAKMSGDCVVIEIVKKLFKGANGSIIKETERLVYESTERTIQSKTVIYKSGHKRKRAKNL